MRYEDLNKAIAIKGEIESLSASMDRLNIILSFYESGRGIGFADINWVRDYLGSVPPEWIAEVVKCLSKMNKKRFNERTKDLRDIL